MLGLVGVVFLLANFILIAGWLQDKGVVDWANGIRKDYLTGTAITIIVVLLVLLVAPRGAGRGLIRRCPVCDHTLLGGAKYCGDCGHRMSRVACS